MWMYIESEHVYVFTTGDTKYILLYEVLEFCFWMKIIDEHLSFLLHVFQKMKI
jgi:hypothetical protein